MDKKSSIHDYDIITLNDFDIFNIIPSFRHELKGYVVEYIFNFQIEILCLISIYIKGELFMPN